MKAVKIYQAGGPKQLIYQDVPTPNVKDGWSLVKIKGFGINHPRFSHAKANRRLSNFRAFWTLNV